MRLLRFKPADRLDRLFEIGILLKGFNGALEAMAGLILLVVGPTRLRAGVIGFVSPRATADPNDLLAAEIVRGTSSLSAHTVQFAAIYLLIHGGIKLVLVIALLQNRLWAYPLMMIVLIGFISYQLYRISATGSPGLIALTLFDSTILVLTWREYRRRRHRRSLAAESTETGEQPVEAEP